MLDLAQLPCHARGEMARYETASSQYPFPSSTYLCRGRLERLLFIRFSGELQLSTLSSDSGPSAAAQHANPGDGGWAPPSASSGRSGGGGGGGRELRAGDAYLMMVVSIDGYVLHRPQRRGRRRPLDLGFIMFFLF